MVCLAPGPSRLPILPPPPLAPPLRHARIGILLCTLQLLPPSPLPFLLLILFFFYLSACLYFPPSMLNSVAQEPQDLTFLTFSSVLPANLFLLKETHAWSYARQVFLVCWIFKNVCFPHFILHANSLTVGTSYGKESQENEFSFTQFRSSNCVIINLLFASVSALYRKKKYCQLGCLLFWRRGVARVPVWSIFCPWLGILFQW